MTTELNILDKLRSSLQTQEFTEQTKKAYLYWGQEFVEFQNGQDLTSLGIKDIEKYLQHLAAERYAPSQTRNQALQAIMFLYKDVLGNDPDWIGKLACGNDKANTPTVLSKDEVQSLLSHLSGQSWLMASLIYGSGLRLNECLQLRVSDINFQSNTILVRQNNGSAGWVTILPEANRTQLSAHVEDRRLMHIKDIADGMAAVSLPDSIRERTPNAARSWGWQFLFPEKEKHFDPHTGNLSSLLYTSAKNIEKDIATAAINAKIYTHISSVSLRNSFAVHLLRRGLDKSIVKAMLGHGSDTEADCLQVGIKSPLDTLKLH